MFDGSYGGGTALSPSPRRDPSGARPWSPVGPPGGAAARGGSRSPSRRARSGSHELAAKCGDVAAQLEALLLLMGDVERRPGAASPPPALPGAPASTAAAADDFAAAALPGEPTTVAGWRAAAAELRAAVAARDATIAAQRAEIERLRAAAAAAGGHAL